MAITRKYGEEQPYISFGIFKIRLPLSIIDGKPLNVFKQF